MTTGQQTRYFEFQDDKSAKFWEVTTEGTAVTVRYGKIGTDGQSQTKELVDAAAAAKHVAKLVAEKTGKGYVESGDSAVAQVASEPVSEVVPTAPRKKAAAAKKATVTNPAKDPDASPESLLALLNKDDATNRLLARHPRASADLLEKLSHSSDKATRQGVAANPNTPPETYVKLGQQFPKEFLANPALDLLLMLNPALMEEVPEALLVRLLKQADCPASLLTWAAGRSNSKVQLAVAMNANAPESARQRLGQSFDPAVREAVRPMSVAAPEQDPEQAFEQALRERIGSLQPYELQEAWKSGDIGLAQWSALPLTFRLAQVTNSEAFSPACVARVLRDSGKTLAEIRALLPHYPGWEEVAKHPFTPVGVLEALAKDSNDGILRGIAVNPSTPEPLKVQLIEVLDWRFSMSELTGVATNPATPALALEQLSKHSNEWIRHAAVTNPAMPVPILKSLAQDSERDIRCSVAENTSTPEPILETLAKDSKSKVREAVARNPSTPEPVLEVLTNDANRDVVNALAVNPSTPVSFLEILARSPDIRIRSQVAENPSTSLQVLETLARDSEVWVRRAVAGNPSTTPGVLEKLSTDKDTYVKEAAISNPNTPLPALIKQVSAKAVGVRQALASQSHRSPVILHSLWKDPHDSVRQAVASSPGLTQAQLDEILQGCELETDLATLLVHPNLSIKSVECIFDKLFTTPAAGSAWYLRKLAEAGTEIRAAAQTDKVTFYHGKDPNKAVLAKRALAPLMALCAGPFIEPARLVKVAVSTDWLVRAAVARNPGTPPNLIKKLSADVHPLVAALARKNNDKEKSAGVENIEQGKVELIFKRGTEEILNRIPKNGMKEHFEGLFKLFSDDVWYEKLTVGQVSWITAALMSGKLKNLSIPGVSSLNSCLALEKSALMIEAAVAYEREIGTIDSYVRIWASEQPECPVPILHSMCYDEDPCILLAAIGNPMFPPKEIEVASQRLVNLRGNQLQALVQNKATPVEILAAKATSKNKEVRMAIAANPSTPVHTMESLGKDSEYYVRRGVAENLSAPMSLLDYLSKDSNREVRVTVACNPSTSLSILSDLAMDPDPLVRYSVVENPSTPNTIRDDLLESLSKNIESPIREKVAENKWARQELLEKLAKDKSIDVRESVARNINTPSQVLEKLANDPLFRVRHHVAENPSTPIETQEAILEAISIDSSQYVRRFAADHPSTPIYIMESLANDSDFGVRRYLAKNKSLPVFIQEVLAMDSNPQVRKSLAENPCASVSVLEGLSTDSDSYVRLSVASNPSTPVSLLEELAKDESSMVRNEIEKYGFSLLSVLARLSGDHLLNRRSVFSLDGNPPSEILDIFLKWWLSRLQRSIQKEVGLQQEYLKPEPREAVHLEGLLRALDKLGLLSINVDNKTLTKASRSKDWLVRLGVALHPSSSEGILKILRSDSDSDVARAASMNRSLISSL